MSYRSTALLAIFLCTACDGTDGATPPEAPVPADPKTASKPDPKPDAKPDPKPDAKPDPTPQVAAATIVIASVTMVEDCPDREAPAAPAPASSPVPGAPMPEAAKQAPADEAMGDVADGDSQYDPCSQSTMQLALSGHPGPGAATVKIESVRLVRADTNAELAPLKARKPLSWNEAGMYEAWDERLPPDKALKASYKLSVPNWADVEAKLGAGSVGRMFVLQVEVSVDGRRQTIVSPEFAREEPEILVTRAPRRPDTARGA
jgi:hypothetical protein